MTQREIEFVPDFDLENFKDIVASLVESGTLTRERSEYGVSLDEIKDAFRPIAEAELERQGK